MHGGRISASSARKIRNAVEWLVASASEKYLYSKKANRLYKWKLSFLTLTLPTQAGSTDIQVKSLLNNFLTLAKHNYGLKSYIWKAEPQLRGVIHFHITSDAYMWKNSVQFEWNRLLSKSGLLNGHSDAPSIKIHSVYRIKNMAAYLTKYFVKAPTKFQKPPFAKRYGDLTATRHGQDIFYFELPEKLFYTRPLTGRLWGCSHNLSKARSLSYTVDTAEMRSMNDEIRAEASHEMQKTYCNFFKLPADYYDKLAYGQIKHDYEITRKSIQSAERWGNWNIHDNEGNEITDKKIIRRFAKQLNPTSHGKS